MNWEKLNDNERYFIKNVLAFKGLFFDDILYGQSLVVALMGYPQWAPLPHRDVADIRTNPSKSKHDV